eukprot:UN05976
MIYVNYFYNIFCALKVVGFDVFMVLKYTLLMIERS